MNDNEIPTPETDALLARYPEPGEKSEGAAYELARSLERRLSVAREGMQNAIEWYTHNDTACSRAGDVVRMVIKTLARLDEMAKEGK